MGKEVRFIGRDKAITGVIYSPTEIAQVAIHYP